MSYRLHHVGYLSPDPYRQARLLVEGLDQQIVLSQNGDYTVGSGTDLLVEWLDEANHPDFVGHGTAGLHHLAFSVVDVTAAYEDVDRPWFTECLVATSQRDGVDLRLV